MVGKDGTHPYSIGDHEVQEILEAISPLTQGVFFCFFFTVTVSDQAQQVT